MIVKLTEKELGELIKNYLFEDESLKSKENFEFEFQIKYYEGSYEDDGSYIMSSYYSYTESINVLGKEIIAREYVKLSFNEIFSIVSTIFEREGYKVKFNFYYANGICFEVSKLEQKNLVLSN